MSRIDNYYKILELSYNGAVEYLLNKCGVVIDNYFYNQIQ